MGTMQRIAPIFAVHDLDAAMRHYQRLGFTVRAYAGGGYGFATRDGIEIHLGVVPGDDRRTSSAYLFVDNADDLAAAWRSAGVEVHSPQNTEWGQHEGAVADPDGNVIRFGSPIGKQPRAEPATALDPAGWPEGDPALFLTAGPTRTGKFDAGYPAFHRRTYPVTTQEPLNGHLQADPSTSTPGIGIYYLAARPLLAHTGRT